MLSRSFSDIRELMLSASSRKPIILSSCALFALVCLYLLRPSFGRLVHSSVIAGGVPGFYVIDNIWYHNRTFYLHDPLPVSFPDESHILSGFTKLAIDHSLSFKPSPSTRLKGTTFFLNEGSQGGWNGLYHYYHFAAENILGGFAALASVRSGPLGRDGLEEGKGVEYGFGRHTPDRIIIPWEGGWKDKWGENELVVKGIFPKLIDGDQFQRLEGSGEKWVLFDRVVLIDRWASHRHNPAADFWNKMAVPVFDNPHQPSFFRPVRDKFLRHYGIHPSTASTHKIIYIDRQNTDRRLFKEDHEALLEVLRIFSIFVQVEHVKLEDLALIEQIEMVSDCSIMIGIHGNGLTHEMWMPENATLIEIFPPGSFLRDYQSVAEVLHHPYYAIWNDSILTRDEWDGKGEEGPGALHDGREIPLYTPLITSILKDIFERTM